MKEDQGNGSVYSLACVDKARAKRYDEIAQQLNQLKIPHTLKAIGQFKSEHMQKLTHGVSYGQMLKDIQEASILLDVHRGGWSGLSLRCFEAIGMNKKLITTNEDIVHYDFYHPDNILVLADGALIPQSFFEKPYQNIAPDIKNKYTIDSWALRLLSSVN